MIWSSVTVCFLTALAMRRAHVHKEELHRRVDVQAT